METRAPFVVVGAFVLAAIVAVFGFVYWLHNTGGLGPRATYHVQFDGSVPGLLVGAGVLFNGIRVGEVTDLGLAPDNPRRVNATISVASTTPVRSDTKVGLEFQGLTGVPVIALEGGTLLANSGAVPTLIAEAGAGQSMTQAARDALRKVDSVLTENSEPLKKTIANLQTFTDGLARNTGKLDSIIAGLEKMTGGGTPAQKITYDLRAPQNLGPAGKTLKGQLAIPEPTAVAMLETQRMLFSPAKDYPGFADVLWADSIPKLLQARLIESFENYDIAHAPLRTSDIGQTDFQLLIDVRRFRIAVDAGPAAEIGLSARIVDKNGKVIASRLFEGRPEVRQARAAGSRRRLQRCVRSNCEGYDRLDRAGAVVAAGLGKRESKAVDFAVGTCRRYSSVFRNDSRSLIWSGSSWNCRHGRMAGDDALGQGLGEGFDRVALVQRAERWRDLERAWSHPVDGMAARAIGERESLAALLGRRGGQGRCRSASARPRLGTGQVAALRIDLFQRGQVFDNAAKPVVFDLHQPPNGRSVKMQPTRRLATTVAARAVSGVVHEDFPGCRRAERAGLYRLRDTPVQPLRRA